MELANEKEELVKEVEEVWLKKQNIENARHDREMIIRFLTGCKYQVEKTKTKMKNFYDMRRNCRELFRGRDPLHTNLETLLDLGVTFPLPGKTREGVTIMVVKATANDPRQIPMTEVFKTGVMSVDLVMEIDRTIAGNGVHVVVDMSGASLGHALQMTPSLIRKVVHLWQNCYPTSIKGLDFVNSPPGIEVVLNIFRRFLRENLKNRIRIHGFQMSSLHSAIDPKLLPAEYGGNLGPAAAVITQWKRKVQFRRLWFSKDETVK